MKTYDSFKDWYEDQTAGQKKIITKLRRLIKDVAPNLVEGSKWTNGVWLKGDLPIIFLHTKPDHVQLGFFAGANLADPKKVLRGNGKYVRHIRIERLSDVNESIITAMVRKAVRAPAYK